MVQRHHAALLNALISQAPKNDEDSPTGLVQLSNTPDGAED